MFSLVPYHTLKSNEKNLQQTNKSEKETFVNLDCKGIEHPVS